MQVAAAKPFGLLSQGCHAICSSPALHSGSFYVLKPASFNHILIRSITPRSPLPFAPSLGILQPCYKTIKAGCTIPFTNPAALTGLHCTSSSLIHFSRLKSTRCLLLFCSPVAPLRLRSPCVAIAHVILPFHNAPLSFTCIVLPPSYHLTVEIYFGGFLCRWHRPLQPALRLGECVGLYCHPLYGGSPSASIQSFLPLYGGRKPARRTMPSFFLAAGAFTCNKLDLIDGEFGDLKCPLPVIS